MHQESWRRSRGHAISEARPHLDDTLNVMLGHLVRIGTEVNSQDLVTQLAFAGFVCSFKASMNTDCCVRFGTLLPHLTTLLDVASAFSRHATVLRQPEVIAAIRSTSRILVHLGPNWEAAK